MKKISILIIAVFILFAFVSCNSTPENPKVEITATVFDKEPVKLSVDADTTLESLLKNTQLKTLIGEETEYIVLVNGKVEISTYTLKNGDQITVLVKGEGTETSPLLVFNADEFKTAIENNKSIKFISDITVPANTWFANTYTGTIDGDGHKLIIDEPPMDVKYASNSEFALFGWVNGTIKNLEYETNGMKALVYADEKELIFENVTVRGEMNGADTNVGSFLLFVNDKVSFNNCTNYANIIDKVGGNHYGSAFIGGYMQPSATSIIFENCKNYGNLFFGKNAAFLIGNPHQIKKDIIKITNCYNYGLIQAFGVVGGISWPNSSFNDTAEMNNYNKDSGKIEKIDNSIKSFTVEKDGSFKVTTNGVTNIKIDLQFNITYYLKGTTENGGNRNMTIEYSITEDNKLPVSIQIADKDHEHESIANGVLYIDPFAYEFKENEYDVNKFPTEITYYAIDINPKTNTFRGMASCTISK